MNLFQHYKNEKLYAVISRDFMIQENDEWVPAVSYVSVSEASDKVFVRSQKEFSEKFKEVPNG